MPVCCPAETPAIIDRFYLVGFKDWINLTFITLIVKIRVYIICIGISLSYIIFRRKIKTFTEKAIVTISYPIFIKNLYSFVRAAMIHHQRPTVFINDQTVAKPFIKGAQSLFRTGNPLPRAVAHGLFFTINLNIVFRITVDKIN